jgi:uncharacterized membrane protein
MIDPLHLCLALGPVAIYFLLLGLVNLSRRPRLATGARDAAALAMAVAGLVIVGPMELLFPDAAAIRYGPFVWLLLIGLYVMLVVLCLLSLRPRLVLYNITTDKLRPILADVVERLDENARWAGDALSLPGLGAQLYIEGFQAMRSASLTAAGRRQNLGGWRRLEKALRSAIAREDVPRNPAGLLLLAVGLGLVGLMAWQISQHPQDIIQSLKDFAQSLRAMPGM